MLVKLEKVGEQNNEESIPYVKNQVDVCLRKAVSKIHRILNNKKVEQIEYAYGNARRLDVDIKRIIKEVIESFLIQFVSKGDNNKIAQVKQISSCIDSRYRQSTVLSKSQPRHTGRKTYITRLNGKSNFVLLPGAPDGPFFDRVGNSFSRFPKIMIKKNQKNQEILTIIRPFMLRGAGPVFIFVICV